MKRTIYILLLLIGLYTYAVAQGIGTWKSYMAYYTTNAVADANTKVFAVANNSLYSYDKDDKSIYTYSKPELSDMYIDTIAYNPVAKTLLIIYSNQNIDLLSEEGVYNIPHLMNNINIQDKKIHNIDFQGESVYLATGFGVMLLNMKNKEITDTYRLNRTIYSSTIYKEHIYAATDDGILYAPLSSNLLDPKNWTDYPSLENFPIEKSQIRIRKIAVFQDNLCLLQRNESNKSGNGIYNVATGGFNALYKNDNIRSMVLQNNKLIAYTTSAAVIHNTFTDKFSLSATTINGISSNKNENVFWVAGGDEGLKGFEKKNGNIDLFLTETKINSPKRDLAAFMTFSGEKLLVAGGGRWENRSGNKGTLMVYDNQEWFNFDENKIRQQSGIQFSDVTSVAVDPANENHYFASTWGEGVFEFLDNEFKNRYTYNNSALQTIYPNNPSNYVRVDGLCYDKDNNLWMTNSEVANAIVVLKPDGSWDSYTFTELSVQYNLVDKILIRKNGHKWVNVPRVNRVGILVFEDQNNYRFYSSFQSTTGESISANAYYCMAEDHDGVMWIGTNLGPIRIPSPNRALDESNALYANRIVRTSDDGVNSWFLDGESVRCIAVDGGNRIWLGTESSGLFIISADGQETYENFTVDNSPLPSNFIESIAINPKTGEAFIGTNKGIVSYMGGATQGEESYSNIYAFPNPVRPEHNDQVTVTGLMMNSNVKITDISGNLIIEGKSLGGQFTWNCRKKNGERVATGIYLVLSATDDENKKESVVTKIMVVK